MAVLKQALELGKDKYDWAAIKSEYLASEYISVSSFLKFKFGKPIGKLGGNIKDKITGWRGEKDKLKEQVVEDAKEIARKKYAISHDFLYKAKLDAIKKVVRMVDDVDEMRDMKTAMELIKIELNEPTSYIKEETTQKTEVTITNFHDIKPEAIEDMSEDEMKKLLASSNNV